MPRTVSAVVVTAFAAIAVGVLAGCAPEPAEPSPSPTVSASASPTGSPTASPTVPSGSASPAPSASAGPDQPAMPIDVSCLDLVSLDTMYQFDPNFALIDGYAPDAGTRGSIAVNEQGIACRWQQLTSGETIDITAARPSATSLNRIKGEAGVTADGETFASAGALGTVQIFGSAYWVTASSSYFTSADDARLLTDSAVAAIG